MQSYPTISDADIVPESYQMRLMAWRDEFTRGYFEIGDIANEIVMANMQNGTQINNATIYSAVGRFCGKSGRTVRDYAEISAFFPQEIRDNYDVLPFSHFRFARTMGRDWEKVLDYSLDNPSASEDKLAFEFGGVVSTELNNPMVASTELNKNPTVAASDSSVAAPVAASVAASPVAAGLSGIYILSNLVSQAETVLSWELKNETRRKLILGLDCLKDVLEDLSDKEPALMYDYQMKSK